MICDPCTQQQHDLCAYPKSCPCQHRPRRTGVRTAAAAVVAVLLLAGCSNYNDKRGRGDAPVMGGRGDDSPAEVLNYPDKFANVASKCDGHGHRVYVVTHGKTDPPPVVVDDATCPGGASR